MLLRQIDDVMARLSVTSQTQSLQTAGTVIGPELRSGPASGAVIGDEADVTDALVGVQTLVGKARPVAIPAPRPVPVRRWWPAVVGLGLLGVIAFAAGRGLWFARDPVTNTPGPVPPVQQIGHVVPLFNGVNTGGWRIEFGNWVPIPGEAVLQGTDGVVSRRLPRRRDLGLDEEAGDGPPLWYCLELPMQPGESAGGDGTEAAGELHFGLTRESVPDSNRYVLRRSGATLVLGSRRGDKAPFERDERIPPRPLAMSDDAAVELQRLPVGWFVTINGEHYAALPLESSPLPEFRLLAEGTARFSDLYLHAVQQAETAR